jgi:hypothetical protein
MLLAILLAATTPYLEMSGGPVFLHQSGRRGVGSGPLLRLNLGTPVTEVLAAELWLSGAMDRAPLASPGDRALVAAGAGGRLLVSHFGEERKWGLWLHAGAGLGVSAGGDGSPGPTGFAGALLSFQPFLKRFMFGIEADGVAWKDAIGLAVLPSLRCTF